MEDKNKNVFSYIFLGAAILAIILIYVLPIDFFESATINGLIKNTLLQAITLAVLVFVTLKCGYENIYKRPRKLKSPTLILAAFLVALANFPIYSIFTGKAEINDGSAIFLLVLNCIVVGAEEELFFRGIVYPFIKNKMDGKKNKIILSVIISSSIFSLFHLFNLFSGEVGYTLLQVFYTFFLGCMLSTVYESEDNIFICATLHATFNFCGNVVRVAGSGEYFSVQLILTVLLVAVLAGIITLTKLLKLNKTPNEE